MNEKQLAALIRKNAAKAAQAAKNRAPKNYDATLPSRDEDEQDLERADMFKEMRRREF